MVEAARSRRISELPKFRRFAGRSMRKDILSPEESKALFPDDSEKLAAVWRLAEEDATGHTIGLDFRLRLHAGMRPAEGRALTVGQLYPPHNGILIVRHLDLDGAESLPRKSVREDPRWRRARIPRRTMEMLTDYLEQQEISEGLVFQVQVQVQGQALEIEVAEYIEAHAGERDERGHRRVVRNGRMPQRDILTSLVRAQSAFRSKSQRYEMPAEMERSLLKTHHLQGPC